MVQRNNSPIKIFSLVIAVAFAVIALAVGYVAVQKSTEGRSKAGLIQKDYMRWDFTKDAEGWTGANIVSKIMAWSGGGVLTGTIMPGSTFNSPVVNVPMPVGNKSIVVRMSVSSGQPLPIWIGGTDCTVGPLNDVKCGVVLNKTGTVTVQNVGGSAVSGSAPITTSAGVAQKLVTLDPIERQPAPPSTVCIPQPTCPSGQMCPMIESFRAGGYCPPDVTPKPSPVCVPRLPCMDATNGPRCLPDIAPGAAFCPQPCVSRPVCKDPKGCAQKMMVPVGGWCPDTTPYPTTAPVKRSVTFTVTYALSKGPKALDSAPISETGEIPNSFIVPVDGSMTEYTVKIPLINSAVVRKVGIQVQQGALKGDRVLIDSVRLVGDVTPVVTCVQPPTCRQTLMKGTDGSFRCPMTADLKPGVTYCPYPTPQCIQPPTTCNVNVVAGKDGTFYCPSLGLMDKTGMKYCEFPKPTPTPPAPANCYYQAVKCVKAPCNAVLVCTNPKVNPPLNQNRDPGDKAMNKKNR